MFKTLRSTLNSKLFLSLLLIASPWMLLFVTTGLIARNSVFSSIPVWSDELSYWHEVLSFSTKGFNFGYYTINESLPKYLSFGSHGFGTISVYALFAKVFGWKAYSIVIANAFFLSFSFLFIILLVKPAAKQIFLFLLFTVSFAPLILFCSTSMSELLNYSILIVYFGLLYKYIKENGKNIFVLLVVFCVAISFIRIIYIILILPILLKNNNEFRFDKKSIVYIILWIFFGAILFIVNGLFVSPYPDSYLNELFLSVSISDFFANFAVHFFQNTVNFINPVSENLIQVSERYFVIFITIYSLLKSNILHLQRKKIKIEYFIVFLILILITLINIAVYDVFDWRDFRVLAPVLFGCVLFLLANGDRFVFRSTLIINVFVIIVLIFSPKIVDSFNTNRYTKPISNGALNELKYDDKATSKFDNTIVVNHFTANEVINIPAGIGITYCDVLSDNLKSRFIYTDKKINLSTYRLINFNLSRYLYEKEPRTKIKD